MSDPIEVAIQAAFKAQLTTPDLTDPVTPIAWPQVPYTPIGGQAYIEVRPLLKAQTQHPALSFAGSDIQRGILQIDAVVSDGSGEAQGTRLAGLIQTRFDLGTSLVAGGYKLLVNKVPQIQASIKDAAWVRYPVSIPYVIITTRA